MKLPIRFPDPRFKLAREAAEYRDLSPADRVAAAFELSDLAAAILSASPSRERQLELLQADEEREHQAWREVIDAHGREAREDRAR